jgi:hypothetical protein
MEEETQKANGIIVTKADPANSLAGWSLIAWIR